MILQIYVLYYTANITPKKNQNFIQQMPQSQILEKRLSHKNAES